MYFEVTDKGGDIATLKMISEPTGFTVTVGEFSDEELRDLVDSIHVHLQEKHGDAL